MLMPFPTFESSLTGLLHAAEELRLGRLVEAAAILAPIQWQLSRVRGSHRHERLAQHVGDALSACQRGETECALHILVTAFAAFIPRRAA